MLNKIIISVVALGLVFAAGRYSAPTKIETKTVEVQVEKKIEVEKIKEVKVEVIKPDGSKIITTTIDSETKSKTDIDTKREDTKIVENKHSNTNISLLAGADIHNPKLVYGIAVSKGLLGPISIGIWGMTNYTVGASVGLQF